MAGDLFVTVVGNLTDNPDLRQTPAGKPVLNLTVAQNTRFFDRHSSEWKDGDTLFVRCNIWDHQAVHAAQSLRRGMRVIVTGKLKQRSYDTAEGEKRYVTEVLVDEIGPSLRGAVADVAKIDRNAVDPREPAAHSALEPSSDPAPAVENQLATVGAGDDEPPF
ncbi:Single-stranded DNA-binding protein [Nocardia ninae]|uniref:Single-stranded DNA-binding protein n=1 Tax=Nocardia ninae NBRC 108245 TaxID=1210091 RepID=A0A511MTC6_9NOCA|nr:single-stranded DNA-binding protein [Nocardia ninae]GEM43830.1 single-stranded DNA-binding protein [Nocardia ninae NBRC 108245]